MGNIDPLVVLAAALGFFALGLVWYGTLFGRAWQRAAGLSPAQVANARRPVVLALAFLFSLLISLTLAHQYAMTGPSVRAIMMIAAGYGAMLMAPALGIAYLILGKSGKLFAIDAGYFVVGMIVMGASHVWLG